MFALRRGDNKADAVPNEQLDGNVQMLFGWAGRRDKVAPVTNEQLDGAVEASPDEEELYYESTIWDQKVLLGSSHETTTERTRRTRRRRQSLDINDCEALGEVAEHKSAMGQEEKALDLWLQILLIQWKEFGRVHEEVADTIHKISVTLVQLRWNCAAMVVLEELIYVKQELQGDGNETCAKIANLMCVLWEEVKKGRQVLDEAQQRRENAVIASFRAKAAAESS